MVVVCVFRYRGLILSSPDLRFIMPIVGGPLDPCLTYLIQKACVCAAPASFFDAEVVPTFPFSSLCWQWLPLAAIAMRCLLAVSACSVPCHGFSRPLRRWCPASNGSASECRNTSQGIRQALLP